LISIFSPLIVSRSMLARNSNIHIREDFDRIFPVPTYESIVNSPEEEVDEIF